MMLLAQAIIILNVARDNFSVFYDEHTTSNISKNLEKKKNGIIKMKNTTNPNADSDDTANPIDERAGSEDNPQN